MESSRWTAIVAGLLVMAVAASTAVAPAVVPRGVVATPTATSTATPSPTPPPESRIGIYANAAGTDCDLNTNAFNPFNVFILVKGVPGLTAADFKVTNKWRTPSKSYRRGRPIRKRRSPATLPPPERTSRSPTARTCCRFRSSA